MMSEMTIRERMLAVYNNRTVDRPALGIYSRYLPRGAKELEVRAAGVGIIEYYPSVSMLAPPWHFYSGYFSEVKNLECSVKYFWDYGVRVEQRLYETPVGSIFQESSIDPGGIGSEHIRKHYITSVEDYKVMQYIVENTVFSVNHNHITHRMEDMSEAGVMLGRLDRSPYQKCLIELAGPEQFLIDLFTEQEVVEELLEAMEYKLNIAYEMALDTPADVFWEPDNVTSDMTPPKAFEKYCLPFYQKNTMRLKETGKPVFIHVDGKMKALVDLLGRSGFDGIESFSFPQIGGDITWEEVLASMREMTIIPNFPANLCMAPEQEVKGFFEELLHEYKQHNPLMLQVSEDIPIHEWQNVLPMLCDLLYK